MQLPSGDSTSISPVGLCINIILTCVLQLLSHLYRACRRYSINHGIVFFREEGRDRMSHAPRDSSKQRGRLVHEEYYKDSVLFTRREQKSWCGRVCATTPT